MTELVEKLNREKRWLPELSDVERQRGRDISRSLRMARTGLKEDIKAGNVTLEECLGWDWVRPMKVLDLLRVTPGVGNKHAARVLELARLHESKTVGGLGVRQQKRLLLSLKKVLEPSEIS